ncbi:MAG TPA: hypothetical protein ACYCDB_01215 [Candidatus Azoamicus sp.]
MLKYIKKLINNNNNTNTDNIHQLDKNYKRFEYLSNSISKKNEILESNDAIGGYYKNKIILPKNINITSKKDINLKCFIYKLLFSTISNNKDYYLPKKNKKLDYLLLASLLTVKTINKTIKKKYPQFKALIKKIHPIIIKERNEHLVFQSSLLELVLKKIMYEKNKIYKNITTNEKKIIYEIENMNNLTKIT